MVKRLILGAMLLSCSQVMAQPPRTIWQMHALNINLMAGVTLACGCMAKMRLIGSYDDKSTWAIDYPNDATGTQKAAGQSFIDNFDVSDPKNMVLPR